MKIMQIANGPKKNVKIAKLYHRHKTAGTETLYMQCINLINLYIGVDRSEGILEAGSSKYNLMLSPVRLMFDFTQHYCYIRFIFSVHPITFFHLCFSSNFFLAVERGVAYTV